MNGSASASFNTGRVPMTMSRAVTLLPYARASASVSGRRTPPDRSMPANAPCEWEYDNISAPICASVAALPDRPTGPAATEASTPSDALSSSSLSETAAVHDQQHEIGFFRADLQTPAAFRELHEYGRAPALRSEEHTSELQSPYVI